jgi:predicted GH43/DUF377 family glycosyl hydrolase
MIVMKPNFRYSPEPALAPAEGCDWASKMVLNPAIIKDPESDTLHMLFRATGPWPQKQKEDTLPPYPIFLGYATSEDGGASWDADFSRPALAPALNSRDEDIWVVDYKGRKVRDYANGCIEDPRIFPMEGELYVSVACRMFPPGPYWMADQDPPVNTRYNYVPDWVEQGGEGPFYEVCRTNNTVTVLYKLNLDKLKQRRYEEAFTYVCPLSAGHVSDNRDVFLFPEKMRIDGKEQYVALHRPMNPKPFPGGDNIGPSIYMAASETLEGLAEPQAAHQLLATSIFDWEKDRIGASWPPLRVADREWLVSYHGKKDIYFGYTQSFMIVRERENDFPVVIHRCPERLMYAQQEWELPTDYPTPCLFTTAGIVVGDELIMSYGAADQKVGISWVDFAELVAYVRLFDAQGRKVTGI